MKFKNKPNKSYKVGNNLVWASRSCAVNGVILLNIKSLENPNNLYVLAMQRGPNAADYQGLWNIVAGYLDWNESGKDAIIRETWEESGLNLNRFIDDALMINRNDLSQPWHVKTDPSANRQNVSLRYGIYACHKWFPDLNKDNNEVIGEVGEMFWMSVNEIDKYDWAFDHDKVIKEYIKII